MKNRSLASFKLKNVRLSALLLVLLAVLFGPESFGAKKANAMLAVPQDSAATNERKAWLIIRPGGRRLEATRSYRLDGAGKINFKQGGRVIELPEGLTILVNDERVTTEREVREGESVRITDADGKTLWEIAPLPDADAPSDQTPSSL